MKLIFDGVFGSKLYGTSTPNSDTDFKSVFIPTAQEIILGCKEHFTSNTGNSEAKNTAIDVDHEYFSLKNFIELATKGETIAIDMIHTPDSLNIVGKNEIWDFIRNNRQKFYTTNMKAYLGYVKKQAHKYGIKGSRLSALRMVKDWVETLPETKPHVPDFSQNPNRRVKNIVMVDGEFHQETKLGEFLYTAPIIKEHAFIDTVNGNVYYKILSSAFQETLTVINFKKSITKMWESYGERARLAELNEGIDWKSLHHAVRGGLQLIEIYKTGDLIYPLKDADLLLKIKNGTLSYKEVAEILDTCVEEVENSSKLASLNGMPEKVDSNFWNEFIFDVYSDVVVKSKDILIQGDF